MHDPPLPAAAVAARLAAAPSARSVAAVSDYGVAGRPELTLHVAPCAALRELIRFERCTDGDGFQTASASLRVAVTEHTTWPAPGRARTVTPRADPTGRVPGGVFATPGAVRGLELPPPRVDVFVRVDPRTMRPEALRTE